MDKVNTLRVKYHVASIAIPMTLENMHACLNALGDCFEQGMAAGHRYAGSPTDLIIDHTILCFGYAEVESFILKG